MLRISLASIGILIFIIFISSCGDVEELQEQSPDLIAITNVLKDRWQKGYMREDVELYMSAYWENGFYYVSDMGTPNDTTDDVEFIDIRQEKESAIRVFERYQDIEIELSEPPEVTFNEDQTEAEVRNHYKLQVFVTSGTSLEGGYTGLYAEGDNVFTFEKRENGNGEKEWRITVWRDEAFSPEEINKLYGLE